MKNPSRNRSLTLPFNKLEWRTTKTAQTSEIC
jgi:hypothetical protein